MRNHLSSEISFTHIPDYLYRTDDVLELSRVSRMEKIPTAVYETAREGARAAAQLIADRIREKQRDNRSLVLSLVSGRTMTDVFEELVRLHQEEGLSFRNVVLFNLFEYYPLPAIDAACFGQINEQLISRVDIPRENIYTFDASKEQKDLLPMIAFCERRMQELGGVDLQLLGIGRNGNIGFNEPGSPMGSATRLVVLDNNSKEEAKAIFGTVEQVPPLAITMGIGTILHAKEIVLCAWGEHKAQQIATAVEGPVDTACPASALQMHGNVHILCDLGAAMQLTRIHHPWLVTSCQWDKALTRRAIVWLCEQTGKPILKLTNRDYADYGLSELITQYGSAYDCNIKVFNDLQHTITGWPGGKPNADDTDRPERAKPYPKDILIFSPHPDDDVISMGGTFQRLIKQGHNVHVAYETSGCIAVEDSNLQYFLDFLNGFNLAINQSTIDNRQSTIDNLQIFKSLNLQIKDLTPRQILDLKALIRRGEATAADRFMGLPEDHIHFLNLPFYETGTVKKGDLSQRDVDIVKNLLLEIKPQQMFVAGDLADPHGTHKVCLDAVLAALDELKQTEEWLRDCRIWMYRGAWMEWEVDLIEMAVPMSPEELRHKRNTILRHQSQMESAPFMGDDERLFWQRAEDRNHTTAELYARLGLANYEAIEAFVQYHLKVENPQSKIDNRQSKITYKPINQ